MTGKHEGLVWVATVVFVECQVTAAEHPRVDYDSADSISSEDEDDDEDDEFAGTSRRSLSHSHCLSLSTRISVYLFNYLHTPWLSLLYYIYLPVCMRNVYENAKKCDSFMYYKPLPAKATDPSLCY